MAQLKLVVIITFCSALVFYFSDSLVESSWTAEENLQMTSNIDFKQRPDSNIRPQKNLKSDRHKTQKTTDTSSITLEDFQHNSIRKWRVRKNTYTGGIQRLRGGRISLGRTDTLGQSKFFVKNYSLALFDVPVEQLDVPKRMKVARERWNYEQYVNGWKVYGAALSLIFEQQKLVLVDSSLAANLKFQFKMSDEQILKQIKKYLNETSSNLVKKRLLKRGSTPFDKVIYVGAHGPTPAALITVVEKTDTGETPFVLLIGLLNQQLINRMPAHQN